MNEIKVTIYSKGRKFYYMRYVDPVTGQEYARTTGKKSKREAERAAATWQEQLRSGRYVAGKRITWEDFRDLYNEQKLAGMAKYTQQAAETVFNHLERTVKPARLSEMTTQQMSRFAISQD